MSECSYFWTNFHKSVESDPVCPAGPASGYMALDVGTIANADPDEYLHTVTASPASEDGLDLLDLPEAVTSLSLTPEWVDLGTLTTVGLAIIVSSGGEGGGE